MDINSLNEAKKAIQLRREIALEKLSKAKEDFSSNEEYASIIKQIKLNTLNLSKALANNSDLSKYEKNDIILNIILYNIHFFIPILIGFNGGIYEKDNSSFFNSVINDS